MSRKTSSFKLQTAATVSAATQTGTFPTDVANEVNLYINVTAAGTTMTPTLQVSPDEGTTWFTHTAFSAITTTGLTLLKVTGNKIGRAHV